MSGPPLLGNHERTRTRKKRSGLAHSTQNRWRVAARWAVAGTLLVEAVTVALRLGTGVSGAECCRTAPLIVRIHRFLVLPLWVDNTGWHWP